MYVDRQPILDLVESLRPHMSLSKAIEAALEKFPGPCPDTVRKWVGKPSKKTRPTRRHFNIGKQAAVDRVFDLMEREGLSRLAACRAVLPTVSTAAWGRKARTLKRLYRWCDGPKGDRFTKHKLDHLDPMELYDYENYRELGYTPAAAYKLTRQGSAPGATG